MEKTKHYVVYKPCEKPTPKFQENGYNIEDAKFAEMPGIEYYEDDIGYYFITGRIECADPKL